MRNDFNSSRLYQTRYFTIIVLVIASILSACSLSTVGKQQSDSEFEAMLDVPIQSEIHLLTEQDKYRGDDWIGLWVGNNTNDVLEFEDQTLGLRVYQYDDKNQNWVSVAEPIVSADPQEVVINPGPRSALPIISVPVVQINTKGNVRLVIEGKTSRGKTFATYKDIEIID